MLSLLQQAQIQAAKSVGSSSQTSTGKVPWDNPYVRGINIAKEQPPLKRPYLGRVADAGAGHKHSAYGFAEPSTKESQQAKKSQTLQRRRPSRERSRTWKLTWKGGSRRKLLQRSTKSCPTSPRGSPLISREAKRGRYRC
jgi:hypothetical protein